MADDLPLDTPVGVHRLRRAEDREEIRIRAKVYDRWLTAFAQNSPHGALMIALDEYKRELGILAIKRLGMGATR